jgi:hypothetical protein
VSATQVHLTVGGAEFWRSVEHCYGSLATVGKTMLPAKTMPKYMRAENLDAPDEATVQLIFTMDGATKHLQKLVAQGDAAFIVQGQVGRGKSAQVMFELVTRPSRILGKKQRGSAEVDCAAASLAAVGSSDLQPVSPDAFAAPLLDAEGQPARGAALPTGGALEQGTAAALATSFDEVGVFGPAVPHAITLNTTRPDEEAVHPLQDAVWLAVGFELVQIVLDLIRLIGTVSLLLAPWRLSQLLVVSLEPTKRWPSRKVDMLDAYLLDEAMHAQDSIAKLHVQLTTAARGGEAEYPAPELRDKPWQGPPLPACRLFVGLASSDARVI